MLLCVLFVAVVAVVAPSTPGFHSIFLLLLLLPLLSRACRYRAIVVYSIDVGCVSENPIGDQNVYFLLNRALRNRNVDRVRFGHWKGFLFYLLRALDNLPAFQGTVYRGGNRGIDQQTVAKEYSIGRTVQWAAFSSTTKDVRQARCFVNRKQGVLFKLRVFSGRDISAYSFFPTEDEILLSPNSRFVVTSEMYKDEDGYCVLDLAENQANELSS